MILFWDSKMSFTEYSLPLLKRATKRKFFLTSVTDFTNFADSHLATHWEDILLIKAAIIYKPTRGQESVPRMPWKLFPTYPRNNLPTPDLVLAIIMIFSLFSVEKRRNNSVPATELIEYRR